MTEEQKPKCDIDDIMCQMEVLGHLRGMKNVLGDERFKSSFPELEGLSDTIADKIGSQEITLKEALEKCGLPEISGEEKE
ncbi:hypothetical protein ES703_99137 [subsurface metagenome]